jgi:acyl-CoA reductase-like NAD-dependent aldehyde dehydrogenase
VAPVILTDVPENALAVSDETFGPTLTVRPVINMAEAVSYANAGRYGLGSAVFARDRRAAMAAARSLRTGMTSVNSVIGFATVPALPFGGVGESGFGRIHGADGLREFTRPKAITRQRMRPLITLMSFGRTDRDMKRIITLVTLLHGRLYRPRGARRGP